MKNQKITAETSYKNLKTMVPDASGIHTPKGETLVASDREILISVQEDSSTIIVYKNGFFAYIDDQGEVTARAVCNCHVMKYEKADGGFEPVGEKDFEDLPFTMVLSHFGMENIMDKKRKNTVRHENLSLDSEQLPNDPRLTVPNFADEIDLDGEGDIWEKRLKLLPEALDCLTDKQRAVVVLHYLKKKTHREIASALGINRSTVEEHLEASLKKLKKFFQKHPCR